VEDVRIIEIFEDAQKVGEGKKSVLLQVIIQPKDIQITGEELDGHIMKDIIASIVAIGGIVRDGL
jgi:phenylalanyl-tRNA synthetase beta subunit